MSRKVKLVTPKEYAETNGVAYTTVLYWLQTGRIEGAVKHETPRGPYWELPEDTPRPKKLSGRPKKASEGGDQAEAPADDREPTKAKHRASKRSSAKKASKKIRSKKGAGK